MLLFSMDSVFWSIVPPRTWQLRQGQCVSVSTRDGMSAKARYAGMWLSQGIKPAYPRRVGPEMQALAPRGVAAVPDLRNGEGKKSPLSRLPADNTESARAAAGPVCGELISSPRAPSWGWGNVRKGCVCCGARRWAIDLRSTRLSHRRLVVNFVERVDLQP